MQMNMDDAAGKVTAAAVDRLDLCYSGPECD